jgi:hypothetical protein
VLSSPTRSGRTRATAKVKHKVAVIVLPLELELGGVLVLRQTGLEGDPMVWLAEPLVGEL